MVLDSEDADLDGSADLYIKHSDTSKFVFIGLPIILTAALGGVYEALWKKREIRSTQEQQQAGSAAAGEEEDSKPGILAFLHSVVHYQYRPLGQYSP